MEFGRDKIYHFGASCMLYLILATFLSITNASDSFLIIAIASALSAFAVGIGKEIVDYFAKSGIASYYDILWNGFGVLTGVGIHYFLV